MGRVGLRHFGTEVSYKKLLCPTREEGSHEDLHWKQGGESNQYYPTAEVGIRCGGALNVIHAETPEGISRHFIS